MIDNNLVPIWDHTSSRKIKGKGNSHKCKKIMRLNPVLDYELIGVDWIALH